MGDVVQGDEVGQIKFRFHNGTVYCEKDFLEQCCNKCTGCGFAVAGGLAAMDATWHSECFVCFECDVPIMDTEERAFIAFGDRPLCATHGKLIAGLSEKDREEVWYSEDRRFVRRGGTLKGRKGRKEGPYLDGSKC